jgi:hypothetical protein
MNREVFTLSKKIVLVEKLSKIKGYVISINNKSTKPFIVAFDGNTCIDFEIGSKK